MGYLVMVKEMEMEMEREKVGMREKLDQHVDLVEIVVRIVVVRKLLTIIIIDEIAKN